MKRDDLIGRRVVAVRADGAPLKGRVVIDLGGRGKMRVVGVQFGAGGLAFRCLYQIELTEGPGHDDD